MRNVEGLTFVEWLAASGGESKDTEVLRLAWERGEDPTEYR